MPVLFLLHFKVVMLFIIVPVPASRADHDTGGCWSLRVKALFETSLYVLGPWEEAVPVVVRCFFLVVPVLLEVQRRSLPFFWRRVLDVAVVVVSLGLPEGVLWQGLPGSHVVDLSLVPLEWWPNPWALLQFRLGSCKILIFLFLSYFLYVYDSFVFRSLKKAKLKFFWSWYSRYPTVLY